MLKPRSILALLFLMLGCATGPSYSSDSTHLESVELPPELQRVLSDYENAWNAQDAEALAALFTKDGFVLSNKVPPVRGRAAITRHYANAGGNLILRGLAFGIEGNLGYIIGGFALKPDSPDVGKFTLVLARDGQGKWLIISDMDNSNG